MPWTTLPMLRFVAAAGCVTFSCALVAIWLHLSFQRFRPPYDLRDLLGDLALTRPVVRPRQDVDHVAGRVGRVLHRRASRPMLGRRRLDEGPVHLVPHVDREKGLEDRLGGRLEDVVDGPGTNPGRTNPGRTNPGRQPGVPGDPRDPGLAPGVSGGVSRGWSDRKYPEHGRGSGHRAAELGEHHLDG